MASHLHFTSDVTVRRVEDLIAYQFAEEFKLAVYDVIKRSPSAQRSFKYREQLEDAAAGIERTIAEGFGRRHPAEFVQFLRYALASLAEARTCLRDGIHRKYFVDADCEVAFTWARRCRRTLLNLLASQRRRIADDRGQRALASSTFAQAERGLALAMTQESLQQRVA
jgi:four helix bundle protein